MAIVTRAMSPLMGLDMEAFRAFAGAYFEQGRRFGPGFLFVDGTEIAAIVSLAGLEKRPAVAKALRAQAFAVAYQRGYALVGIQ